LAPVSEKFTTLCIDYSVQFHFSLQTSIAQRKEKKKTSGVDVMTIFGEKLEFFFKKQCYDPNFAKKWHCFVQKTPFFGRKYFSKS
jgi:hypothetical protein